MFIGAVMIIIGFVLDRMNITVAGTEDGIVMVEAGAAMISSRNVFIRDPY